MLGRLPTSYAVSLVLACALSGACSGTSDGPASPAPIGAAKSALSAESSNVRPHFLPDRFCPANPSFGAQLVIVVSAEEDVILRQLRFSFFEHAQRRVLPEVFFTGDGFVPPISLPTSQAVPIPTGLAPLPRTSPIPIPGAQAITGLLVRAGRAERLPVFLRFGCDIEPDGTFVIDGSLADLSGGSRDEQLRVALAR